MPLPERLKVPITVITGFLGAGKTTLLNHILKQKDGRRVAVIENEFGEIDVDSKLVAENLIEKEELVSMENGCVCCSLRSDIVTALAELDRRAKKRGQPFDNVLLETTGLADPAPVAFTFFANPWIGAKFRLDSILCLVDALHISKHLTADSTNTTVDEAVNQIAFADTILLNKTDLVSPEELARTRELIRSINVTANIVETQLNNPECPSLPTWDTLMNVNSFSIERALQVDPTFMDSDDEGSDHEAHPCPDCGSTEHQDGHCTVSAELHVARGSPSGMREEMQQAANNRAGDAPPALTPAKGEPSSGSKRRRDEGEGSDIPAEDHRMPKRRNKRIHDLSGVGSVGIQAPGFLDQFRFNMFMRDLLSEKARDIYRSKGVLCVKGQEQTKFVFQGVHETICFGPAAEGWREGETPMNQIVFIGRNLSRTGLMEGFRSCIWIPLPDDWQEFFDKRTGQPYYVNSKTKQKSWERPVAGNAAVQVMAIETSTKQPPKMQPRKSGDLRSLGEDTPGGTPTHKDAVVAGQ